MKITHLILLTIAVLVSARRGFGPGDQDWGYVEVRPHSHMFWWLHYTTATDDYTKRPLIIWLQGGPAGSASGEGNILMSGLVDQELNVREHSYVNKANVLYIDSPVGAGYSYVDIEKGGRLATNTSELSDDFITLFKGFLNGHEAFQNVEIYILGESFGGKFAPALTERLHHEIEAGNIKAILKGVGMAYPATQHIDNIPVIGETLYQAGIVDMSGKHEIDRQASEILKNYNLGQLIDAWVQVDELLAHILGNYNLSFFRVTTNEGNANDDMTIFHKYMDETVSPTLNISKSFGFGKQRDQAREAIADKLIPTTSSVTYLLDNTNIKVVIYNGQLDWIVNTQGTYTWVMDMNWHGTHNWKTAQRTAFYVNGIHEGHKKQVDNLQFYWIKRAGHRLPNDNPSAMNYILKDLIGY